MQTPVRVIGIGSPFGEDQIGWLVTDALQQSDALQPYLGEQLQIIQSDRPGVTLLSEMEGAETVILIDAALSKEGESSLRCLTVDELINTQSQVSSHGFGVQQALELGQSLGQLPKEVIIIAIIITGPKVSNLLEINDNYVSGEMIERVEQTVLSCLTE
jgi:hydrogenase maturation protease